MKRARKYLVLAALIFISIGMQAQKGLEIERIFNEYGRLNGSTLIELAKDVLGENTCISKYKSLIRENDPEAYTACMEAIEKDIEEGLKLLESNKDGKVESGYYCLKKDPDSTEYEYILFKNKPKKLTLVYIRGAFPPLQLEKELDKLKNLFIKINNKRINLSTL